MADATYTAKATSSGGGRGGHVRSSDGIIDEDVKDAARARRPGRGDQPGAATIDVAVSLASDGTGFGIGAVSTAHLPGLDQARADELIEGAHQACPYSKATRGNVDVELTTVV